MVRNVIPIVQRVMESNRPVIHRYRHVVTPELTGRARYVYKSILLFAGGKRYVMRSPIRLWFELDWNAKHQHDILVTSSQVNKRKNKFGLALQELEERGYIRRIGKGCIEVLENIK